MKNFNWQYTLYVATLAIILAFTLSILLYVDFDQSLLDHDTALIAKLQKGPLEDLLNGNGINNIPELKILTTNEGVTQANKCSKRAIRVDSFTPPTDDECVNRCANTLATALTVEKNDHYISDENLLEPGFYCRIGPKPHCNMKTTIAILSTPLICRPKFPRLIGGPVGRTIVACNNINIQDPFNRLWDYSTNEPVRVDTTIIINEDELLSDGSYRFRCKFYGVDVKHNKYMEHPFDRFHPIRNYCAALIFAAHDDVKHVWENNQFRCDCGDKKTTMVSHIDPNDPTSQCSSYSAEIKTDVKNRMKITVPYPCFTIHSPIEDVGRYFPCKAENFHGEKFMENIELTYSHRHDEPIAHPFYEDFPISTRIAVRKGLRISS
ncbi:uncharacterized LOC105270563 [Fopius arisanus]|uniref:ORF20 protein n=1 Tax=Fopius arisanus TaxID=64838 RepID=A0A0C9RWL2_9HYME|nr:uncharacterized LOC105270563 [Fopius arisanus]KAG8362567.1 pif-2 [Fopius arisanus]